jgi:hypothetical protein
VATSRMAEPTATLLRVKLLAASSSERPSASPTQSPNLDDSRYLDLKDQLAALRSGLGEVASRFTGPPRMAVLAATFRTVGPSSWHHASTTRWPR